MKNIILLFGISLFCYACGCPATKKVNFNQEEIQWLIYKPNNIFNYRNQKGEKRSYKATITNKEETISDYSSVTIFSTCSYSFNAPIQTIKLVNNIGGGDTIRIEFRKNLPAFQQSVSWITECNFNYYKPIPNNNQIDNFNFTTTNIDTLVKRNFDSLYIDVYKRNVIAKSITLRNNKLYNNVLKLYGSYKQNIIFYHKTAGIIRFETANGDIWELEN